MNAKTTPLTSSLAIHLDAHLEMKEIEFLGQLVLDYYEGKLSAEHAAEVAEMIQDDADAKAIYERILEADAYANSEQGKAWLESMPDRIRVEFSQTTSARSSSIEKNKTPWWKGWLAKLRPDDEVQPGYVYARTSELEEFHTHLENKITSRLWKREDGRWVLWLVTRDVNFSRINYRWDEEIQHVVELLLQANQSYRYECVLTHQEPAKHPVVSLTNAPHPKTP